ncbi:MAG: integrase arm-type DNA-binding domain-containing protein [gamma proteobacterium symbiont of Bathyaustriella thionipta]|nr:integrase arm-type DNA-binding domain-containing protein [gamma proteobacterium symbiont of Bathyaustriella thionipta]
MALTATKVKNTKPKAKPFKLYDSKGLFLQITPKGAKLWRFKFRRPSTGKEGLLALGSYPATTLKAARARRDEALELLEAGTDPGIARQKEAREKKAAAANSFEAVAGNWMAHHLSEKSPAYRNKVTRLLQRDVFPWIGREPITELTAPDILDLLRRQERRGIYETAHVTLQVIGQVFRFGVANSQTDTDPTPALRGALKPVTTKHMAAPTDPVEVGGYLRAFDSFKGTLQVQVALQLLPLLFCRPGELRQMRWQDIDLAAGEWRYTVSKTKTDHIVALSTQAVALLTELQPVTGHMPGGWVFVGARSPLKPMSDAAIGAAYKRLGIDTQTELIPHGWRSVARTLLHERLNYDPAIIEHQLAHRVADSLGDTYNRTKFIDQRREMMQVWADYLGKLKAGGDVIQLPCGTRSKVF